MRDDPNERASGRIEPAEAQTAAYPPVMARVAAIAIDGVLLIPTQIVALIIAGNLILTFDDADTSLDAAAIVGSVVVVIAAFVPTLYFAAMHASRWQATVGKRLMRMAVVHGDGGEALGPGRSFVRAVVFSATVYAGGALAAALFTVLGDTTVALFVLMLVFVAGLFLVPAIARPDHRCFHDLAIDSCVIDDPRRR